MGSSVVRIPTRIQIESKRLAALQGVLPGDLLAEAWTEYLESHKEEFAAELEQAARILRDGTSTDAAEFASRNAKERAKAAADRFR